MKRSWRILNLKCHFCDSVWYGMESQKCHNSDHTEIACLRRTGQALESERSEAES